MKPELGVSDSHRRSIFSQWILGLPLEAIESSELKNLYLDDCQPGAARFRINNGDEGSSGAVTLKILKKGTCTVLGRAPGVSGEWNTFKTARKYTGR